MKYALHGVGDLQLAGGEVPAAAVDRPSNKVAVAVVGAAHAHGLAAVLHHQVKGFGSATHPEPAPDLGGILMVDCYSVMGGRTAKVQAFCVRFVFGGAAVDEHAPVEKGELEAQGVGMTVAGHMIWPDWRYVQKSHCILVSHADVAGVHQVGQAVRVALDFRELKAVCVVFQVCLPRGEAQRGVVEKGDVAVWVAQQGNVSSHLSGDPRPGGHKGTMLLGYGIPIGPTQVNEV